MPLQVPFKYDYVLFVYIHFVGSAEGFTENEGCNFMDFQCSYECFKSLLIQNVRRKIAFLYAKLPIPLVYFPGGL